MYVKMKLPLIFLFFTSWQSTISAKDWTADDLVEYINEYVTSLSSFELPVDNSELSQITTNTTKGM